jgi:fatty acid desaturase
MAVKSESPLEAIRHRSPHSAAERAALRDIWLYAVMLFVVGSVIVLVFSVFAQQVLLPLLLMLTLVCVGGAGLLHLSTRERWGRARRQGKTPDLTRIFG